MISEHAVTYRENLKINDLDYLIQKANKLGKSGRTVLRVYQQEDNEGHHVYFEVTNMRDRSLNYTKV